MKRERVIDLKIHIDGLLLQENETVDDVIDKISDVVNTSYEIQYEVLYEEE